MIRLNQKISSAFISLKFRDFRYLVLGQFGSSMAVWMDHIARGWLIYEMTASPFLLGLTIAVKAVPMLSLSIFAGVIADRYSRKNLMLFNQAMCVILNLMLAILVITHRVEVWHVIATAFFSGVAQVFDQPARNVLISDLVEIKYLNNAISLNSVAFNVSRTLGPSIAGISVAVTGVGGAYFLQTFVYIITMFFTAKITEPAAGPGTRNSGKTRKAFFQDTMEGFKYLKSDKILIALMGVSLIPPFLAQPYQSLMPIFAKDILKVGPEGFGFLLGFSGIGCIAGALYAGTLSKGRALGTYLLFMALAFGLFLIFFAFSTFYLLSAIMLMVLGFFQTGYHVLNNTLIQTNSAPEYRGRVMGVYFLDRGLMPLGTLLAGTMAATLGAPWTVGILGTITSLLLLMIIFAVPNLRRLH